VLEIFGLDDVQELVYLHLIDQQSATRNELYQAHPSTPRSQVDGALHALEESGLATRRPGSRGRYEATPPDLALLDWLREHAGVLQQAQAAIGTLTTRYQAVPRRGDQHSVVKVVQGQFAYDRRNQAARGARYEVRCFEHPPFDPASKFGAVTGVANALEMEGLARGVRYRIVYDREAIRDRHSIDELREGIEAGEEARVTGELPLQMLLIDDQLATLPLWRDRPINGGMLVVRPSPLLDALSALFEMAWRQAQPLTLNGPTLVDDAHPPLDEPLITLAGLLSAGLTDQAIARHLGVSIRTVERRIQQLLQALGAKTRYQAGTLAARELRSLAARDDL
jgi:predicted transcriptional regulator